MKWPPAGGARAHLEAAAAARSVSSSTPSAVTSAAIAFSLAAAGYVRRVPMTIRRSQSIVSSLRLARLPCTRTSDSSPRVMAGISAGRRARMRIELPHHREEEGVGRLNLFRPHVRQPSDRSSDFADGAAEVDLARLHERLEGGLELLAVAVGWQRLSLERLRDRLGGFGSILERGQKTEEIGDDLAPLVAAERPDGAILRLRIGRARELEQDPKVFRELRALQVDGRRVQAIGEIDPAVFGRQDRLLRERGRDRRPR